MRRVFRLLILSSVFLMIFLLMCPCVASADAGIVVEVTAGEYPDATTIKWSDRCYTYYGLLTKSYIIAVDGEYVATVGSNINEYSTIIAPGKHEVTVVAYMTSSFSKSTTVQTTVRNKSYEIIYNLNGGNGIIPTQDKEHNYDIQLSSVVPTKECCEFLGWSTTVNGSVKYQPGDTYSANGDEVLYAVWLNLYTDKTSFEFENGEIVKYIGTDTEVKIPPTINGIAVTTIGEKAFLDNSNISSVIFPDTVVSIEYSAFQGCSALNRILLPANLKEIDNYAFRGCSSLVSIDIPESITTLGTGVFFECYSLKTVVLPDSITVIPSMLFADCSSLTEIDLPDGIVEINAYAFQNCIELTSIKIPNGVTNLTGFNGCTSLSNVIFPENLSFIKSRCFENCVSLETVNLPVGLTRIGEKAFLGCVTLKNVNLPETLEIIDEYAFKDCIKLTDVTIPSSVEEIERQVFNNTGYYNNEENWENDVLYNGEWVLEAKNTISGHHVIKKNAIKNASYAFAYCEQLIGVDFPEGTKIIADNMFVNSTSLTDVYIPNTVTTMEQAVFYGCTALKGIELPDNIKEMNTYTFYMCSSLESVKLPYSITIIPERTFCNCTSLKNVAISNMVLSIGSRAFLNADNLTDIYYSGTEVDWSKIVVGTYNTALDNANKHYGSNEYSVLIPIASVQSGEVEKGTAIDLNCLTDGAEVFYTLDGTEPTVNSLRYTESIIISQDTTIKVIAVKNGMDNSEVAVYNYTVKQNTPKLLGYTVTHKKTNSYYKFYITFETPVDNAEIYIALFSNEGSTLNVVSEPCEGDEYYIITVPLQDNAIKGSIFVWNKLMQPIAETKIEKLNSKNED